MPAVTHRERFFAAVNHQPTDRPPMDFLGEPWMREALVKHLGISDFEQALQHLDIDIRQVSHEEFGPRPVENADGSCTDIWGIRRRPVVNSFGAYDEVEHRPFAEMIDMAQVKDYPWPAAGMYDFTGLAERCRALHDDYVVVFGGPEIMDLVNGNSFGRGMEQLMVDIALEDPVGVALLDKRQEFFLAVAEAGLKAAGGLVDVLWIGDDYGTQNGLLVSERTWETVFGPRLQAFIDLGHRYGAKVMLHSCGSNRKLIRTWIEMGLDIYQAVQAEAVDMDPVELFREFGRDITFHGMVDVQGVLPYGTPEDVARVVRERIDASSGSGYVLSPSHNFQPDVPMDNILALYGAGADTDRGSKPHAERKSGSNRGRVR